MLIVQISYLKYLGLLDLIIYLAYNYQKTIWTHYDSPHYLRVNKTLIETIKIHIRDEQGNKVLFEDSNIIAKLHFRPKKNFY